MSTRISRRSMLRAAGGAGGAAFFFSGISPSTHAAGPARGANDTPGIALIGCGGRGRGIAREAERFGRMLAVCDVDESQLDLARQQWPDAARYGDFRKLLERGDIDAIVNGTPDHWHTLVNLSAVRAGKDVYSEKPLTLTIEEGQRLVRAVRETGRVLQTGSQQRSDRNFRLACELVRNGRLGTLQQIDVWLPHGRREGPFSATAIPPGMDWDRWLGPTPLVPYLKERCHVTFRYWWEYSGGTMTDWGAHHLDIAQWAIGSERSGPVEVEATPLVEMIPGGFTAYSEYKVHYRYANGVKLTCRSTTANAWNGAVLDPQGQQHGVRFQGTDGWIFVTRGRIEASVPELLTTALPDGAVRLAVSDNHMGNFFDCMRTRAQPICDAEIGHRSASVCHLGVIALRTGRKLAWDPASESFAGDAQADAWRAREMRRPYRWEDI